MPRKGSSRKNTGSSWRSSGKGGIWVRTIGFLASLLTAWGCAPALLPQAKPVPDPNELLQRLRERDSLITTLEATGSLKWQREGEKGSVEHVLLLRRPSAMRLDALSPMGPSAVSVSIKGGKAEIYVPSEGKVLRGQVSTSLMERMFSLPLEVEETLGVLCGIPPLCVPSSAQSRTEGRAWVLDLECDDSRTHKQISLDPEKGDPLSMVILSRKGQVLLTVSWDGYRNVGEMRIPTQIRAEIPSRSSRLELRIKEVDINIPMPEEKFHIIVPQGTSVEPLS